MRGIRRQGMRNPSSAPFSPASLGPSLILWLRADMGITIAGAGIDTWNDQSASGKIFRQTTDANRMQFVASDVTYGGRPVAQSTNITMWATATTASTSAQPHTAFIVGECGTANGTFFSAGDSSNSGWLFLNNTSMKIFAGLTLTEAHDISTPHVLMAVFNGASSFAGASDWLTGGTSGAAGATGIDKFAVGAYNDGLFGAVCKIAEVIVCNRVLTSGELSKLAAYFTSRYSLVIT